MFSDGKWRRCETQNRCTSSAGPELWAGYVRPRIQPTFWHGSLIGDKQDASGLHCRRNRYYDPATGRFTQEDPIGLAGGLNLYGFAAGDPVSYSDPYGLCPDSLKSDDMKCTLWNKKQGIRAVEIVREEMARGNPYAEDFSQAPVHMLNEELIQQSCGIEGGRASSTGCFDSEGHLYLNADRNPAAISQTGVHEFQHVRYRGTLRGAEPCARWRAVWYVRNMSRANKQNALSGPSRGDHRDPTHVTGDLMSRTGCR